MASGMADGVMRFLCAGLLLLEACGKLIVVGVSLGVLRVCD